MPQIHIRLSGELLNCLDELRWKTRAHSRNALIVSLLALLTPPNHPRLLGRFIFQNYTEDELDILTAELVRQGEIAEND